MGIARLLARDMLSFICFAAIKIRDAFVQKDRGIRVLVYHSIKDALRSEDPLRITVSPRLFERHIRYLILSGYKIVSVNSMLDYVTGKRDITGREVVLTFDDGFADTFDVAVNVLEKNKVTATYFFITDYIDKAGMFPESDNEHLYGSLVTWDDVSKLVSMNMSVGSHTLSHINLGSISDDKNRLREEIRTSKTRLEERLNTPVKYFAYPFGSKKSYNSVIEEIVRESGYEAAFTNILGSNKKGDNLFKLKRTRIDWNDTLFKFKMKLDGAYDWIDRI